MTAKDLARYDLDLDAKIENQPYIWCLTIHHWNLFPGEVGGAAKNLNFKITDENSNFKSAWAYSFGTRADAICTLQHL